MILKCTHIGRRASKLWPRCTLRIRQFKRLDRTEIHPHRPHGVEATQTLLKKKKPLRKSPREAVTGKATCRGWRCFPALPDVGTRDAGDVSTVCCDQVQSDWRVLVGGRVCSTFKEKFLQEWGLCEKPQAWVPTGPFPPHTFSQRTISPGKRGNLSGGVG